jgi:hypothetical protein
MKGKPVNILAKGLTTLKSNSYPIYIYAATCSVLLIYYTKFGAGNDFTVFYKAGSAAIGGG